MSITHVDMNSSSDQIMAFLVEWAVSGSVSYFNDMMREPEHKEVTREMIASQAIFFIGTIIDDRTIGDEVYTPPDAVIVAVNELVSKRIGFKLLSPR